MSTTLVHRLEAAKAELAEARRALKAATTRAARQRLNEARLKYLIEHETIEILRDEPGDFYKRVCRCCGADVVCYCLRNGGEHICCENGHTIGESAWRIVEN